MKLIGLSPCAVPFSPFFFGYLHTGPASSVSSARRYNVYGQQSLIGDHVHGAVEYMLAWLNQSRRVNFLRSFRLMRAKFQHIKNSANHSNETNSSIVPPENINYST